MAGLRSLVPGWLSRVGSAQDSTPPPNTGFGGKVAGLPAWLARTGNDTNVVLTPSITTVTTVRNGEQVSITGTNFGATQGQVFIGGIGQVVDSWSDTAIVITFGTSYLRYAQYTLQVVSADTGRIGTTLVATNPGYDYSYVNLIDPLTLPEYRLTAVPDLAGGDQIEYGGVIDETGNGTVTVLSDASFVASLDAQGFYVRAHDGTSWGTYAVQDVGLPPGGGGSTVEKTAVKFSGTWRELDYPAVRLDGEWREPMACFVKRLGVWKRFWPDTNPPPRVVVTYPINNTSISNVQTDRINYQAQANDDTGIARIEFFARKVGDTIVFKLGEYSPPSTLFSAPLSLYPSTGAYEVWAVATDIEGASTTSASITLTVTINLIPTVSITSPSVGSTLTGTVAFNISASDPDGTITSVSLYRRQVEGGTGYVLVGTDTVAPYSISLNTTSLPGQQLSTYDFYAVATDNSGSIASSPVQQHVVRNDPAPVLTSTGQTVFNNNTAVQVSWNTNFAQGSKYMIKTLNSTTPTAAQISNGRDAANALALEYFQGNVTTSADNQIFSLTTGTTYYIYVVQYNTQGAASNILRYTLFIQNALAVTASPLAVSGYGLQTGSTTPFYVQAGPVTLSITGGTSPYTVTWERLIGTSFTVTTGVAPAYTTYWSYVASTGTRPATYRAVVTDNGGAIAYSQNVSVTIQHESYTGEIP